MNSTGTPRAGPSSSRTWTWTRARGLPSWLSWPGTSGRKIGPTITASFSDNCATRIWFDPWNPLALSPSGSAGAAAPGARPSARASLNRVLDRSSWIGFATGLIMGPRTRPGPGPGLPALPAPGHPGLGPDRSTGTRWGDRTPRLRPEDYLRGPGPQAWPHLAPWRACLGLLVLAGALTAGPKEVEDTKACPRPS